MDELDLVRNFRPGVWVTVDERILPREEVGELGRDCWDVESPAGGESRVGRVLALLMLLVSPASVQSWSQDSLTTSIE